MYIIHYMSPATIYRRMLMDLWDVYQEYGLTEQQRHLL